MERKDSQKLMVDRIIARMSNPPKPGKRGRQADPSSKSGQIRELLQTDMSVAEIAKKLGCTTALVYNVKARAQGSGGGGGGAGGASGMKKRGPGRPPKSASAPAKLDGLSGILEAVKNSERERSQLRAALERIQSVISEALS